MPMVQVKRCDRRPGLQGRLRGRLDPVDRLARRTGEAPDPVRELHEAGARGLAKCQVISLLGTGL
jgi:hypothetical protein